MPAESSFRPVSDWAALLNASGMAEGKFFGPEELRPHLDMAQARVRETDSDAAVVIVPVGFSGEILWSQLPKCVAAIVAPVRPEAIVFFRSEIAAAKNLGESRHHTLWDVVADQPISVAVTASIDSPMPLEGLPALAPRSRPIPHSLAESINRIGSDNDAGIALRAGLMLIHGDLDGSHSLSQELEGVGALHLGDYWHAIMHRREPDYFNSKYWFRRVGIHPVAKELVGPAREILSRKGNDQQEDSILSSWNKKLTTKQWDSFAFVDLCEQVGRKEESLLGITARKIQWLEMLLLLRLCAREDGIVAT